LTSIYGGKVKKNPTKGGNKRGKKNTAWQGKMHGRETWKNTEPKGGGGRTAKPPYENTVDK